jgi:DNA-binding NarL/FixJ family response regulator
MLMPSRTDLPAALTTGKLHLLLADHSPAVRRELRNNLEQLKDIEIVAETDRDDLALDLFFRLRPEVVVLSTSLPAQGGFEALRCIKRAVPRCAVVLTSRCPNHFIAEAARLLGATGVCPAVGGFDELRVILLSLRAK